MLEIFLITHNNYNAILSAMPRLKKCGVTKIYLRDKHLDSRILRDFLTFDSLEIFINYNANLPHNKIHLKSNELHLARSLRESYAKRFECESFGDSRDLCANRFMCESAQDLCANLKLSYSAHSLSDILNAHKARIDYIFISPIFAVENKNPPLGIDFLAQIPHEIRSKIFALGGINANNIKDFENLGIAGIAGIRIFDEIK